MADVNLASLNFKLHIDDDGFSDDIKKYIDMAQKMNTEVSSLLEGLGKVTSGRNMSQSKKNEMLLGLRNQLKEAEADVSRLESKLASFQNHAQHYGTSPYLKETSKSAIKQVTADLEEARKKVTLLQEAYKKLGGDKALASTFKQTKKDVQDTSIELLQMREYYKQISADANSSAAAQKKLTNETKAGSRELRGMSRMWRDIKNYTMLYFSFEGARRLVSSLVRVSAEFEKQRVSLHAILQDADGAERIFAQIKELAVQSPFQFKELVTYTKQLSAFSIPMEELYDTTKMLADVSAGLGVGMDRLVLAYGQIRSASFLRGQEVRQLTEAGIPILEELRKQFVEMGEIGITAGQVFDKISSRQVTFEMVEKVFKNMTSEGGKFYKMQEVLAETLSGKLSNLTDAYQIMFSEIGDKMEGFLKGTVDAVRSLAENYEKVGKILVELVAVYGVYKAALITVKIAEEAALQAHLALSLGKTLTAAQKTSAAIGILSSEMGIFAKVGKLVSKINPYAAAAAGAAALIALIVNLATAKSKEEELQDELNKKVEDYNSKVEEETSKIGYLLGRMEKLESTTKEYKTLKNELLNNYGQYLDDVQKEALDVGELAGMYDTLAESIRNAQREKTMSEGFSAVSKYYTDEYSKATDRLKEDLKALHISTTGSVYQQLTAYFRDELTRGEFTKEAQKAYSDLVTKSMANTTRAIGHQFANPEDLKKQVSSAANVLKTESEALADTLNMIYEAAKPPVAEDLKDWQQNIKDITDAAHKAQVELGINVSRQTSLSNVVSDVKEKIEESKAAILLYEGIEDDLAEKERVRLKYLEDINKVLLGKATPSSGGALSSKDTVKDGEKRAEVIERQVEAYKRLKEMYESLVEYVSESDAKEAMKAFFPSAAGLINNDFDAEIDNLTHELEELAMAGDEVAIKLLDALGKEKFSGLISTLKAASDATEKYESLMNEWDDFIPDSGALNKVIQDYKATLEKIQKLRNDSLRELANSFTVTDWENPAQAFVEQSNIINEKSVAAEEAALNEARENAKKVIEDIYEDWRKVNVDFNNLSDKTIHQLNKMKETIEQFNFTNLTPEEQSAVQKLIPDLKEVNKIIDEFKAKDVEKVSKQKTEDNVRAWKQLAKNIVSSSRALKEFASASNNHALEEMAQLVSDVGELVQNVADGFRNGAELGAVVAGVTTIANFILRAATEAARLKSELQEMARANYIEAIDERIGKSSTLFGDSWLGKIRLTRAEIRGLGEDIAEVFSGGGDLAYSPAGLSFLQNLGKYSKELGMSLKTADGLWDVDTLEAIRTGYEKKFKKVGEGEMLNDLIEYAKKMKELYADLEKSVGEMFDSLGSDVADSLIESLKATGDAATDLEDVFQNLGDSIFKSMVQSFVIDEVLNKYKDEVMSWWTDETLTEADIATRIRAFAESVKQDIDIADDRISAMYEAFMNNSLLTVADEAKDKSSLGGGVKSITEDTANLLASYINAIRADVAAIRQSVAAEGAMNLPTPTLAEYLTQIQANTYNNAIAAQNILERLDSVMTMSDGPAFRVFM